MLRGPACRCLRRHRALQRAAFDSSPRLRLSPLPCLNLPFEALPPRVSPPQPTCRAACTHPPPFPVLRGPVSRCPAPSRRIPASACDSSPRLRSSPLPCLNLLAATASARMPRQNHNLLRPAHPQPHFLHAFSLLLPLPVAIRRCCAPPCTQHRGSQSSKAPQPEVRGDHPRCLHTVSPRTSSLGGETPLLFGSSSAPPPPPPPRPPACVLPARSAARRASLRATISAASAAPAQSSCTHRIAQSSRSCLGPLPAV